MRPPRFPKVPTLFVKAHKCHVLIMESKKTLALCFVYSLLFHRVQPAGGFLTVEFSIFHLQIIQYQTVRYDTLPLSPISRNRLSKCHNAHDHLFSHPWLPFCLHQALVAFFAVCERLAVPVLNPKNCAHDSPQTNPVWSLNGTAWGSQDHFCPLPVRLDHV